MNKQQILEHEGWKYISSLRPAERHNALLGSQKHLIEKAYNIVIEERPFISLKDIGEDCVTLSVTDPLKNQSMIAILIPQTQNHDTAGNE